VNPAHLLGEVRAAFDKQMREIESNQGQMVIFKEYVLKQFSHELQGVNTGN
jgi:hypothetical protein